MPVSVEKGSCSREDGGVRTGDREASSSAHDPVNSISEQPFEHQNFTSHTTDMHLIVEDVRQLPSPSPSPRSASPSLDIADSSGDLAEAVSSVASSLKYSGSFEKPVMLPQAGYVDATVLLSPLPISKTLPSHELHDIPEEKVKTPRKSSISKLNGDDKVLKLSAAELEELTSEPESLPVPSRGKPPFSGTPTLGPSPALERQVSTSDTSHQGSSDDQRRTERGTTNLERLRIDSNIDKRSSNEFTPASGLYQRPAFSARAISSPHVSSNRKFSYIRSAPVQSSPKRKPMYPGSRPEPLDINIPRSSTRSSTNSSARPPNELPSPVPQPIPLPPMSIPTYLQLELSSSRPSPLYIYRSAASEYPYESSKIKFERLLNFLLLPPQLEQVLLFGSFACLDAWLYTFTILPLRFFKAIAILLQWWGQILATEARFISGFIYHGMGRMWNRKREGRDGPDSPARARSISTARRPTPATPSYQSQSGRIPETLNANTPTVENLKDHMERKSRQGWGSRHRRTKSQPSSLSSRHKADLLQGAVIISSCIILMNLDASRMYHSIRGQAAIKLYVIYNVLEVSILKNDEISY